MQPFLLVHANEVTEVLTNVRYCRHCCQFLCEPGNF